MCKSTKKATQPRCHCVRQASTPAAKSVSRTQARSPALDLRGARESMKPHLPVRASQNTSVPTRCSTRSSGPSSIFASFGGVDQLLFTHATRSLLRCILELVSSKVRAERRDTHLSRQLQNHATITDERHGNQYRHAATHARWRVE